jgi:hypothetical protein
MTENGKVVEGDDERNRRKDRRTKGRAVQNIGPSR